MIKVVIAAACASLGLLGPAAAEDTKPLWTAMDRATGVFESRGYEATAWEKQGEAAQGDHFDLVVRFDAATNYNVLALCGPACSNIDVQLVSPSGMVVASDMASDKTPIASFTPPVSGDYTVRIVMTGCSTNPCAFVTKAFTKR